MTVVTHYLPIGALLGSLIAGDPFSLLNPAVKLSTVDRQSLDRGATVGGTVPGGEGQIAVFAISQIDIPPDALIANARAIENLKRSSFVLAIHRISDPPRLDDLDALVLSPRDLQAAAACKIGGCALKLTAAEIDALRASASPGPDRTDRIQRGFRQIVLSRVEAYLAGGLSKVAPIVNRGKPWRLDQVFREIIGAAPPNPAAGWLRDFPHGTGVVESFLYWSQETYGPGKPVILVTHVALIAPASPGDPAIVIGKQIMATRYMTGGLAMTAITTDPGTGHRYLLYVNHTGVDLLGGVLGPLKRSLLESRLKREVPDLIGRLRQRLERRAPPLTPSSRNHVESSDSVRHD
jgi:hypothetical protein